MGVMTTASLHALGCLLLGLAGAAAAQPQAAAPSVPSGSPLPVEAFFGHPELARPLLSPSGHWLALLVRGTAGRNTLAVLDLASPGKAEALARFTDVDIHQVHWVGDEHLVFDVIDLQAGSGERRMAPGLFSVTRDGKTLRELVKLRNAFLVSGGSGMVDRRLDYNHLLLQVPQPDTSAGSSNTSNTEVIVGEVRFGSRGAIESVVPKRLDVSTGRVRSIAQGMPENARGWLFDAVGEPRLAVLSAAGRTRVHWRAPGQDAWVLLQDADTLSLPWAPHSLDAAGTLYVTTARGPGGTRVLTRFDFASGRPAREPMVDVAGFDFEGGLVSEHAGGRTLGVRAHGDAETTVWFDARMKALQDEVDRRLPGRVNRLSCRRCDSDERVLLIESASDRDPGSILVWRGKAEKIELLGSTRRAIDPARMATLDFHRFQARDGRGLPVWVTQPAATSPPAADGSRPAVVLVHGGPWVRGGHWGWHPMQQFLASRGYVVIEPEFRGSTGYGLAHFRAGWRQWGQAMQDDVADAVLWAAQQKLIDPQRVCIAGASYGGYATLMGLVRHPELYRCGAAWVAVTEPLRLLERSWWWQDDVSDEARAYSLPAMLADAKADAEMLKAISPVQQAARIQAPVLLAFGELDLRVPLVHGKEMRDALIQAGRAPEWIVYPEEGHGWRKLENQHDFARRLEAFFARHLAP